jgi:hypothetical protein
VSRAADLLVPPIERRLKGLCVRPPQVVGSMLDDHAVVLGALRTAMDRVEREVFRL